MDNKRKILVFAAVTLAVIGAYFFGAQNTGLIALPDGVENQTEKENTQEFPSETIVQGTVSGEKTILPSLSFEVVQPTELKAMVLEGTPKTCPQESTVIIELENTGQSDAERVFAEFQNFEVFECKNCNAKKISTGEKIEVEINGCREKGLSASVQFYAVNTGKETVQIKS